MSALNDAIGGLMEVGDKDDFDIEGVLEVLPELGHKRVAIVRTG